MPPFAHLHVHTDMSSRDGIATIPGIVKKASSLGMTACAITDHGNMQGVLEFHNLAKANNIKPIFGFEAYFAPGVNVEHGKPAQTYHLTLLAKTEKGYHNLIKLCSLSYENFYRFPRVTAPLLEEYSEGIIGMSACLGGELPQLLQFGKFDEAVERAKWYKEIFAGDFYYEIMRNGYKRQDEVNENLIRIAGDTSKLVATNDTHYLNREDDKLRLIVSHIAQNYDSSEEDGELWFKSPEEMAEKFADMPELLENTMKIADSCEEIDLGFKKYIYPSFTPESGKNFDDEIHDNAWAGLEKRGLADNAEYRDRLAHELEIIKEYKFSAYLLIVADIIGYARKNGIPVGPGRGSAAGSLTCYCLEITDIDPIRWNLSFERFINPERVSLPDIDMDICADRREEVIDYLVEKYGRDHVAYISTITTWNKKGAVKAVAQSMIKNGKGIIRSDIDAISRAIDAYEKANPDAKKNLGQMMEAGVLDTFATGSPLLKECLEDAVKVEGIANAFGSHAAGIIISDVPVNDVVATTIIRKKGEKDKMAVQCDMGHVEKNCGLIKMDLLGLKNMTIIYKALDNIRKQGKPVPDIRNLPVDNEKAFDFYSSGDTLGIFQMESDGMRQTAQKLRPSCFEDIIALVAMYRPGPLKSGMVDSFIRRKHGEEQISYYGLDKYLEPILKETYGLIIYQEQVMKIAQALAGYTAGGADILRRAMGKKKQSEMDKQQAVFMEGARKLGMPEDTVTEIFDAMSKFAQYGFNKSHAAAYGYISYITAWLKAEYPVEFMAAIIEKEDDLQKAGAYIETAKRFCEVMQPDLFLSDKGISVRDGKIVIGFSSIKGLPDAAIDELLVVREKWKNDGVPTNLVELMAQGTKFNAKFLETMNNAGALDSYIGGWKQRAIIDANKEAIKDAAAKRRKKKDAPSLMGGETTSFLGISHPAFATWSGVVAAEKERDALGICASDVNILEGAPQSLMDSPLRMKVADVKAYIEKNFTPDKRTLFMEPQAYMLAIVTGFKATPYKADKDKLFFRGVITDESGSMEFKGFDDNWKAIDEEYRKLFMEGSYTDSVWEVRLRFMRDKNNPEIIEAFMDSAFVSKKKQDYEYIDIPAEKLNQTAEEELERIAEAYACKEENGDAHLYVVRYDKDGEPKALILDGSEKAGNALSEWRAKFFGMTHQPLPPEKHEVELDSAPRQLTLF